MNRFRMCAILSAGFGLLLAGCGSNTQVETIQITPASQSVAAGQTAQFTATGTIPHGDHPPTTQDVTSLATWSSSSTSIATVSASGMVTAVSVGAATISASIPGAPPATAAITVTGTSGGAGGGTGSLVSLQIIPGSITVGNLQDTGNFLAIGTFSTPPMVRDITNSVTWSSAFPDDFPVSTNTGGTQSASGGIVTAYASGSTTIIAEATGPDGSIQTATATFACPLVLPTPTTAGSCYPGSQATPLKVTLTVYGEGLNTTNWLITAPSATGTPNVINCGPGAASGASVCTGIYPVGTTITVTAPAQTGVAFGGWTYNCTPTAAITAAGPNSCTISLDKTNVTVGAIFNNQ